MRARVTARETVNPDVQCAGVLESADSRALKALGPQGREGSSPSSGTLLSCGFSERSAFAADAVVVAVQPEGVGSAHRDGALDVVGAVARASGAVVVADAVVEARVGVGGVAVASGGAGGLWRLLGARGPVRGGGRLPGGRRAGGRGLGRGGRQLGGRG